MTASNQYASKYQQLLRELKTTVEGLLVSQVANVWSIYGGLNRLHCSLEKIFKHGCKNTSLDDAAYFNFIQGLEWLQPETSKSYFSIDCEYRSHIPPHLKDDKASIWLYRSIENHSLSQKLSWLLSDRTHLSNCYQEYAFLCQEQYAEATMICMRAVERNQASLLTEINPCLFLQLTNAREFHKVHRRCSSFPDSHLKSFSQRSDLKASKTVHSLDECPEVQQTTEKVESTGMTTKTCDIVEKRKNIKGKLRPWHSMPALQADTFKIKRDATNQLSKTTPSTPIHTKKLSSSYTAKLGDHSNRLSPKVRKSSLKKTCANRRKEVRHVIINNCDIIEHTPALSSSQSSGTNVAAAESMMNRSTRSLPEKRSISQHSSRLVESFLPLSGAKDFKRKPKKSFIEDGGMSVLPMTTGYFPKPRKGQSLLSFLSSGQFARANAAELDRENAHFCISEAIIRAMEQLKCKRDLEGSAITQGAAAVTTSGAHHDDEQITNESDPEIIDLKQRIRLRRRQKMVEKQRRKHGVWVTAGGSLLSDERTDTATSVSPCSTTPDDTMSLRSSFSSSSSTSGTCHSSTEDVDDLEMDERLNLSDSTFREGLGGSSGGLSVSMASLYSDADVLTKAQQQQQQQQQGQQDLVTSPGGQVVLPPPPHPLLWQRREAPDGASDICSAEGVALSLISKFSEKQLPRASDLEWLVSEEDAPQALLPMPKSWPVSPEDVEGDEDGGATSGTLLRGTREWAPPRPQIIFTFHPAPSRKDLMTKQNYRCAGCSMKVAPQYSSKFRYCDYLGRYFCTGCHTDQLALIPGRVLQKWDFTRYPVSTFSYRLLDQMYCDPLFRVFELNKNIGKMSKNLLFCQKYRLGLFYLKDFIFNCRFAENIKETMEQEKSYSLTDPEVFSMEDLVNIRSGEMKSRLKYLVELGCRHVSECELCLARGFICELCKAEDVIFPWQMRKVARCPECGICYHLKCWDVKTKACPRCLRISKRRESVN